MRKQSIDDDGPADGFGRVVALKGHAADGIAEAEREEDFGRGGEEGADAHVWGYSTWGGMDGAKLGEAVRP